ncbi:hypothetical protein NFHSH190041_30310 [Shewanella sp. NFH-SH190041]|nr:hypothetical protein NFHSH190041_30310 [Shewanella sp. NFH-SH190041]
MRYPAISFDVNSDLADNLLFGAITTSYTCINRNDTSDTLAVKMSQNQKVMTKQYDPLAYGNKGKE